MGVIGIIIGNIKNMKKAKKLRGMGISALLDLDDEAFYDAMECICEDAVLDIADPNLTEEQKLAYSLIMFEVEVNNGGLCQFFVNSSRQCAPYVSKALEVIGAVELESLFDSFIKDNDIDVNDLSSFKISSISEYETQTERFDFDSFDEKFYQDHKLHQQIIDYLRKNISQIVK